MKGIIYLCIILLGMVKSIYPQTWVPVNTGTDFPINDIYFVDAQTGWFVSHSGLIKKTTDGGQNWISQTSSSQSELKGVKFLDINNGYIVGGAGTVLKTTNSGENWIQLNTGYTGYFYGVDFVSLETGWIVGSDGKIFKTTDGGQTWVNQSPINNETFFAVDFVNENIGNVVGTGGKIYRTNLGGIDWYPQVSGTLVNGFNAVSLVDAAYGYLGGYYVKKTTNGGANWNDLSYSFTNDVFFVNRNFGVVTVNNGNVYLTSDGGANFFSRPTGTTQDIKCAFFLNENLGWVGGGAGLILKYIPAQNVTLTSPNGGENWTVGSSQNITWTQSNVSNVKLEYSTNNGSTWIQIVASVSASSGSYSWTIPNTVSTSCIVRVTDVSNSAVTDQSNSVFSISAPASSITVTSPNGGENWISGYQYSITWTYFNVTNLKIEYTTNNGTSWNTITTDVPASSGSYIWTVPNRPSASCKVRLTSTTNSNITAQSNSNFIISSQLGSVHLHEDFEHTVLPPSGWSFDTLGDTTFGQYWERSNVSAFGLGSGSAGYYFYQANAGKLQAFTTFLMMTSIGTGIISFDHAYATRTNENDQLRIEYSTDEGASWTNLRILNGGIFGELVTAPPTTVSFNPTSSQWASKSYSLPSGVNRVRFVTISAHGNNLYLDNIKISDSSTSKFVEITSPNGGEKWTVGSTQNITWDYSNIVNVKIEYTTNNGVHWIQIVESVPASSSAYSWIIPNTITQSCKVRITDTANEAIFDLSDTTFSITTIFEEVSSVSLPGLSHSAIAWGDYDNDGDMDALITGGAASNISRIYRNNGDETFYQMSSIQLDGIASGSVDWGDFNSDGFIDILLSGFNSTNTGWLTKVYKNIGGNTFDVVAQSQIQNCHNGSTRWGDFDGDGDLDILLTGGGGSEEYFAKIYRNDGNETFSEVNHAQLTGVNHSSGEWGDYDNDGDLDILITGYSPEGVISKIYRNISDSIFSFQSQISLPGVWQGQGAWGDFNSDSFLDFVLTGKTTTGQLVVKLFRNNHDNTFSEQAAGVSEGVYLSSSQWGDFDNDGNLDLAITGKNNSEVPSTKIYRNLGDGTFTEFVEPVIDVASGSIAIADYNDDGAADILVCGENNSGSQTKLYRNAISVTNHPPSAPLNLSSTVNGGTVQLVWDKSADDHTPQDGLSYNIAIGNSPGNYNIVSPMSDKNTGKRRIAKSGNSRINSFNIKKLPPGTYYWTVQSIDGAYLGSPFAQEQSFTIGGGGGSHSLYLDGTGDYIGNILENKITGNTPFTLELWMKNESPNVAALITRGANSGLDWVYNLYAHDLLYFGVNPPPGYTSATKPSSNIWHHIAAVKDLDGLKLFVDGIKVSELNYGSGDLTNIYQLQFGKYFADGSSDYFKGYLTRIRISKTARYTQDFIPAVSYSIDTNTVGQWDFTEGSGSILNDGSLNNLDGTIYGATWSSDFPSLPTRSILVVSPNGGENWTAGTTQNITWNQSGVENVSIAYTANNGVDWHQITASTPASSGSYGWVLPNLISTTCKVKVTDTGNSSITDQSNELFTISAPVSSITIISPNGGEIWTVGTAQNITWTQTGIQNIKIEYSTNNGTSWLLISSSTPANTGSYLWTIPNTVSMQCRIRVSDLTNILVNDQSNSLFSITNKSITVISPNGGENWTAGSTQNITWNQTGVENVSIAYTVNNGTDWHQIIPSVPASSGSYGWVLPNLVSTACKVKVTDVTNNLITDQSNSTFTISAAPVSNIIVTSPNGGENWTVGTTQNITWTQSNVTNVKIEYTTNNGTNWNQISASTAASAGSYPWVVPNTISTNCRVKITDVANNLVQDQSNSTFSISAPVQIITVTSPNGGEQWVEGKQYSITWTSQNIQDLKIEYSVDGGSQWSLAEDSIPANLGSFIWTIPTTPSNICRVKITSLANAGVFDVSDSDFRIVDAPEVLLTSPNGGEKWLIGKQYSITWNSVSISHLKPEYSPNNGADWILIADSISAESGSYIWTIPSGESNNCIVRLSSTLDPGVADQSDQPFTIELERDLTLTAPLAGQTFTSGESIEIKWNSLNLEMIAIHYTTDNGADWLTIADSVAASTESYNWLIPESNSNLAKIRLVYTRNPLLTRELAGTFTILPSPKVVLNSNLSNTYLKGGSNFMLEWFTENVSGVGIYLSTDQGSNWSEVATNLPASVKTYSWQVPQLNSMNCRIKVVSADNPALMSMSQGNFTIYTYAPSMTVQNSWQFGDIGDISNYRMISIPGNTSENLRNVISGQHVSEWNAYWDNGNDANYQVQFDGSETFKFLPGKGFWVLSKNPVDVNRQSESVLIDSTMIYNIALHRGWNIIGNPFNRAVSWADARSVNSLAQNSLIYYWEGKWSFPAQMEPYKGYYFFNPDGRANLKLRYPVEAGLAKAGHGEFAHRFSNAISVAFNGSTIAANFDGASSIGMDTSDFMLPNMQFGKTAIVFVKEQENGKRSQLFIESQPEDSLGNIFRFMVSNSSATAFDMSLDLPNALEGKNIYILDEKYSEFVDLRGKSVFAIAPQDVSRYYSLLVGDDAFINSVKSKYLPTEYTLYQNYPNPFNPETSIKYALPVDSRIKIKLFDILGNEVATLFDGDESAGVHSRILDLSGFASGVYLYRLETKGHSLVKKMILMK